jgi:hypothetical protein
VLDELLKLFAVPEDHSDLQRNFASFIVDVYEFSDFVHEQKSIYLFERLHGPYDSTCMEHFLQDARQSEKSMEPRPAGVNINNNVLEVDVCIYPALAKVVPIEPFHYFVSKEKVLFGSRAQATGVLQWKAGDVVRTS